MENQSLFFFKKKGFCFSFYFQNVFYNKLPLEQHSLSDRKGKKGILTRKYLNILHT